MALNASDLTAAIESSLMDELASELNEFLPPSWSDEQKEEARRERDPVLATLAKAIASAVAASVVEHIRANASVTIPALPVSSTSTGLSTEATSASIE